MTKTMDNGVVRDATPEEIAEIEARANTAAAQDRDATAALNFIALIESRANQLELAGKPFEAFNLRRKHNV